MGGFRIYTTIMSDTEFARWRRKQSLTQDEAAVALGVAVRTIKEWERGIDHKGNPRIPPEGVRKVMKAIDRGIYLEPWPERSE